MGCSASRQTPTTSEALGGPGGVGWRAMGWWALIRLVSETPLEYSFGQRDATCHSYQNVI